MNALLQWIRILLFGFRRPMPAFEATFSYLEKFQLYSPGQPRQTYALLRRLDHDSPDELVEALLQEVSRLQIASNTNEVFYFYFPIVSHILFYKPEREKALLHLLVGPSFANGTSEADAVIKVMQGAMTYVLQENPYYLTPEGQHWITFTLPRMRDAVRREIDRCWAELEE